MSITAKELASILNLSEAAVSMALNGKSGVSTKTRNLVIETAHNHGYDFTKIKQPKCANGTINLIIYKKHGAVLKDTPFFSTLATSISNTATKLGLKMIIRHIIDGDDVNDIQKQLDSILSADCIGIILIGTEMRQEDFFPFVYLNLPIVLVDTYFNSSKMDCVLINNVDATYHATTYLIRKHHIQPGYLKSSYRIHNFTERLDGFYKALRANGMSGSRSIIHELSPSMVGAYEDMKELIKNGVELTSCYLADNDLIAAGAMRALKEAGYKIPEDIAIMGFDNISLCSYLEPSLTTVNVPIKYMGETAVNRLYTVLKSEKYRPIKIEIGTNIIKRKSV